MRAWLTIDGVRFASDDWPDAESRGLVFSASLRPEGTRESGETWWFTEGVWQGENPAPEYLVAVLRVDTEAVVDGRVQRVHEQFVQPLWGHPGEKWKHKFGPDAGRDLARVLDRSWSIFGGYGKESFRGRANEWVLEAPYFNEGADYNRNRGGKVPDSDTRGREDTETFLDVVAGGNPGLRAEAKAGRDDWSGEFERLWANVEEAQKVRGRLKTAAETRKKRLRRWIRRGALLLLLVALALWGMRNADKRKAQKIRELTKKEKFKEAEAIGREHFFLGTGQARVVSALASNREAQEDWEEEHRKSFTEAFEGRRWDEAVQIGQTMKVKLDKAPQELNWAEQLAMAEQALSKAETMNANSREALSAKLKVYEQLDKDYGTLAKEYDPMAADTIARGLEKARYELGEWDRAEALRKAAAEKQAQREALERQERLEEKRRQQDAIRRAAEEAEKARVAKAEISVPIYEVKARLGGREVAATIVGGMKTNGETTPKRVRVRGGQNPRFCMEYMEGGRLYVGEVSMREEEGGMLVAELSEAPAGTSKTIELPRGAKMELVWCPPGRFKTEIPGSAGLFGAQHKTVSVPEGFWIAKTEVTQKQWRCVMGNNPSNFQGDDNPVEGVEEDACREFCRRAGLDLPTVEQWEYACRAGSSRAFGGTGRLESMGWYKKNSGDKTHPVGEKTANDWGLFDMHGNVWELCEDGRQRGGSWHSPEDSCRSATVAGYVHQNRDDLGFRPVRNRP